MIDKIKIIAIGFTNAGLVQSINYSQATVITVDMGMVYVVQLHKNYLI